MWLDKSEYRRLVEERQDYNTQVMTQTREVCHLEEMNRFLVKRVNQLEYIYSQLVAKDLQVNVSVPTIGVGVPETDRYPAPDFNDPREKEQEAEIIA